MACVAVSAAQVKLKVQREILTDLSTIGSLFVDDQFFCYTLEPPKREEKPHSIPAGTYDVTLRLSGRFGRIMPHVENVPGFEGILIHWGNYPKDTEGCLLVGASRAQDFVGSSRETFHRLFSLLADANERGEKMYISYVDAAESKAA